MARPEQARRSQKPGEAAAVVVPGGAFRGRAGRSAELDRAARKGAVHPEAGDRKAHPALALGGAGGDEEGGVVLPGRKGDAGGGSLFLKVDEGVGVHAAERVLGGYFVSWQRFGKP